MSRGTIERRGKRSWRIRIDVGRNANGQRAPGRSLPTAVPVKLGMDCISKEAEVNIHAEREYAGIARRLFWHG